MGSRTGLHSRSQALKLGLKPPLRTASGITVKRFIGDAVLGGSIASEPAKIILRGVHGRTFESALKVMMSVLGKINAVASRFAYDNDWYGLAYVEYKLQQISAPSWITNSIIGTREWLEQLKNSEWFQKSDSVEETENPVVPIREFDSKSASRSKGIGSEDSSSDPTPTQKQRRQLLLYKRR